MKFVEILFVAFVLLQASFNTASARATDETKPLEPEEEECVNQLKLDKRQIEILNNQDITTDDNPSFNAFLGCYWQKINWQDTNGNVNFEAMKNTLARLAAAEVSEESPAVKLLVKQMLTSAVEDCEKNHPPKGSTHGQTAVRVQNCVMKNFNELLKD